MLQMNLETSHLDLSIMVMVKFKLEMGQDIKTGQLLLQGKVHEGLYQFELQKASSPPLSNVSLSHPSPCNDSSTVLTTTLNFSDSPMLHSPIVCNSSALDIWHRRLGHPAFSTVQHVLRLCNISVSSNKIHSLCHACAIAKSHNLPFQSSQTQYHAPLQLVVADLWGPAFVSSRNGFRYFISFVDAYSRYT
ncbi:uncharacterized protein LOC111025027 [Momordica charantia]|uniref:Uncharacterized protein LOC111025027 n=1 Tax=Momordica charantia TaxID=3673 RepID=A0A6J1DWG8_MOMCH|nr:uncharacterized protein LOC111025027 [Momordica charantia]